MAADSQVTVAQGPLTPNESQSCVMTDGQSARMSWCQALSGTHDQICNTVRHFRICWCRAPSLTRGWACSLQLLLFITSTVILGSESRRTYDYILLSQIWDSPNLEGQVAVFIYLRNRNRNSHTSMCWMSHWLACLIGPLDKAWGRTQHKLSLPNITSSVASYGPAENNCYNLLSPSLVSSRGRVRISPP
jgi:hypothetical protein